MLCSAENRLPCAGLPGTPLRPLPQLREAVQLCSAAQLSGPHKPGIAQPACGCVYRLRDNTARTVSFMQSNGTKCLSELTVSTTRYNLIKRFAAYSVPHKPEAWRLE